MVQIRIYRSVGKREEELINEFLGKVMRSGGSIVSIEPIRPIREFVYDVLVVYEIGEEKEN